MASSWVFGPRPEHSASVGAKPQGSWFTRVKPENWPPTMERWGGWLYLRASLWAVTDMTAAIIRKPTAVQAMLAVMPGLMTKPPAAAPTD